MSDPIPPEWIMLAQQVDNDTADAALIQSMCEQDHEFLMFLITRKTCQLERET